MMAINPFLVFFFGFLILRTDIVDGNTLVGAENDTVQQTDNLPPLSAPEVNKILDVFAYIRKVLVNRVGQTGDTDGGSRGCSTDRCRVGGSVVAGKGGDAK
ncbi:unnamed protein product [Lactuca virosa]|uniref:Uncharacterized protein n=1 Tax=Lactuca virosa TaxID=75947 RepID=A0AAU9M2E2_9ASTR|nr:unnamed protein product [Lactuca virosa]